ncbi:MAG: hypothetical protein MUC31_03025 [Bacteroidales bacterium]|jgi:hypothetical protein|nr:hypothetical protein [Bacteroidales bacterium]
MTALTIKLIIILIPGAIATIVFGKLILHKEWSNFKFILYSILFGIFSFLALQLLIEVLNCLFELKISSLTIWENLTNENSIPYEEVLFSSIISILLALLASFLENRKWINVLAKRLSVSKKYGEENLFSRFLNDPKTEFVYLRDVKNNLTYHGWVKSFSENETISEIRLADVSVYSYSESEELYEVEEVYLSLNKTDIIIEKAIVNNSN